jgi:hypothetical protein
VSAATFRTIELRDANGDLVCEEPIKQPMGDEPAMFATFGGRLFFLCSIEPDRSVARYVERHALRCGRAVIHDGQIEGVEVERIVEAVGGGNE